MAPNLSTPVQNGEFVAVILNKFSRNLENKNNLVETATKGEKAILYSTSSQKSRIKH